MGWNEKSTACELDDKCKSLCDQLNNVEIQCLKNVDTAALENGDILCYHADSGTFTNVSKEDIFGQYDIYVDGGSLNLYELVLTDNNSTTPNVIVDMSGLPKTLCDDSDFIAALTDKINTDAQNAAQVPFDNTGCPSFLDGAENVQAAIKANADCIQSIKDGSIFDFQISGDTITWTVNGNPLTVDVTHPVFAQELNDDGTTSITVDGVTIYTSPLFVSTTNASGQHVLFADGVAVGVWDDEDTVSSPHPDYTLLKDSVNGSVSLIRDGVVVATVADNDTVSTPHPEMTFSPNVTNGTDVLLDGVVVYTIPDSDTDVIITQTGPNEYTFVESGVAVGVINTIPDTDTDTVLVIGAQTQNPDGSVTQCFTTTNIIDNSTPNGDNDVCFTLPSPTDTNVTDVRIEQVGDTLLIGVTEDGSEETDTIPLATAQACRLTSGLIVRDNFMDDWVSRSYRFDSTSISDYTNLCRYAVSNSLLSNALADRSHVDVSTRGTASGIMSHATSVNNATASGLRSGVISSDSVEASGTGATAISSNGGLLVSGTSSSGIAVRAVNPSEIRNNWAVASATSDPNIGLTGPAGVYNFIGGGAENTANWSYSGSVHSVRTLADNIGAALYASSDSHAVEERSTVIASQGIINPTPYSTRWGNVGPTATPLSSNTRAEIDSTTGDITTIGTITANATPFPGVTECAVVKKEIPIGTAVRFEGEYGARVCKDGERPHGVTKGKAGICAGGGIDPNNAPFVIEGGVYKRVKRLEVSEHEVVDEVATAPILAKYELDIEKYEIAVAKWTVAVSKAAKDGPLPKKPDAPEFKPVMKMQKVETEVEAYEENKDFDEEKHKSLIQANIEMLGRTWMNTKESIKVDSKNPVYLGANGKIVEPSLGFEVIAARKGEALVFVK